MRNHLSQTDCGATTLVVLGKALQDGMISCEFAMRIAAAMRHLETHRERYRRLYFVGGQGEARAALAIYRHHYGHRFPEVAIATEEQSTNTVENVGALVAMLSGNGPERVDLLSSGYHLERLRAIHTHLPGQSLLQPLAPYLEELVPVPCFFDRLGSPLQQRMARLYRSVDRLNFPRANIEGVLAGSQARLLPWALVALADVNESLRRATLTFADRPRLAGELREAYSELTGLLDELNAASKLQPSANALAQFKPRLDTLMARLRSATDPDLPATTADWHEIELWLSADRL